MPSLLDYNDTFVGNLREPWSPILRQQLVSLLGHAFYAIFQRMQHHLFKYDITKWWERMCDKFIFQEVDLRKKV